MPRHAGAGKMVAFARAPGLCAGMDESSERISGTTLAVLGVTVPVALAALAYFAAPGWLWVAWVVWLILALTAALAQSDPRGRAYLTGTLKYSRYTQLYLSIARPVNDWVWRRVGRMQAGADGTLRPPSERAGLLALMRDALTWWMVDRAMLLAVMYPLIFLLLPWLVGDDAVLGAGVTVFPAADFWPERAVVLGFLIALTTALKVRDRLACSRRRFWRRAANWLPMIAVAVAAAGATAGATVGVVAALGAVAVAVTAEVAFMVAFGVAYNFAFSVPGSTAVAFAVAGAVTGAGSVAGAGAGAVAVFCAVTGAFAVAALWSKGRPGATMAVLATGWMTGLAAVVLFTDIAALPVGVKGAFIFLAVLPLINGLFDALSYATTLATMRKGLATRWAWALGVLDLLIGAVLFLALGATMVAVIAALNALGSAPLFDLEALFVGLRSDPGSYWWLYLILFSTLLPTALHLGIAALAVQGVFPQSWRRRVAQWIDASPASALDAVRGCLAQATIWWLPLMGLAGLGWVLWQGIGHAAGMAGLFYLARLESFALWIGAL